jgi:hypothetical protein
MKNLADMKRFSKLFVLALTVAGGFFLAPAQQLFAADTNIITAAKGDKLYTQFSLFYEDKVHRTTNYRSGTFVPINTEVIFVKANKKEIDVTLPDGTGLKIENVEKYSGENINGIFFRTLGKTAVDLSRFTAKEKNSIEAGEVEPGMSKDAVIAALGYPPKHQTPTLKGSQWVTGGIRSARSWFISMTTRWPASRNEPAGGGMIFTGRQNVHSTAAPAAVISRPAAFAATSPAPAACAAG